MKNGRERMSKKAWYEAGGFANSALFRKADSRGRWTYWRLI